MQLPKQRPLPRASPETNVGRPSSSAVAGPSLGRGRGRGISQKPAWMNNINNNDLKHKIEVGSLNKKKE